MLNYFYLPCLVPLSFYRSSIWCLQYYIPIDIGDPARTIGAIKEAFSTNQHGKTLLRFRRDLRQNPLPILVQAFQKLRIRLREPSCRQIALEERAEPSV